MHTVKEIKDALKNNCLNTYIEVNSTHERFRVISARMKKGELQLRLMSANRDWYTFHLFDRIFQA